MAFGPFGDPELNLAAMDGYREQAREQVKDLAMANAVREVGDMPPGQRQILAMNGVVLATYDMAIEMYGARDAVDVFRSLMVMAMHHQQRFGDAKEAAR